MSQYSIFTAPVLALVSRDFYRDVGRNWRVKSFVYLFLLEIVAWIAGIVVMSSMIADFVAKEAGAITDQIPPIAVKNGIVTADVEQPHFIRAGNPPEVVAILDTTGEVTSLEGTTAHVLLMEKELIVKQKDSETRHYKLDKVDELAFDGKMIQTWLDDFGRWLPWVLYPVVVVFGFIGRVILGLIYSVIGLIIARLTSARITYGGILSIGLAAQTAPILLGVALGLLQFTLPFAGFVGFALAVGYMAFGIGANDGERRDDDGAADDATRFGADMDRMSPYRQ